MIPRRAFLAIAAVSASAGLLAVAVRAEEPQVYATDGVAINGYDPVAYFTEGAPVKGSEQITHEWNGATWQFASAENRDAFAADPDAHAPQYGGYCAYAVSRGYIATTDPDAWTVHDGRLYLNYSLRVRRQWERDIPGNIEKGDANWPGVLDG